MESTRLKKARETVAFLESRRSGWEPLWRDIAEYVVPYKGRFGSASSREPDRGERRGGRIIDSTATRAVRVLAAGMQGGAYIARAPVVPAASGGPRSHGVRPGARVAG